jgi:hypothetical protein
VFSGLIASIRKVMVGDSWFESLVRTAESRSIAVLWVSLLFDHDIPARVTSQLSSAFMGDGMAHGIFVREVDAQEAKRILAAYWDDQSAEVGHDQ